MTLYRCGRCEEQCRLDLEVGAVPDRCPLDGKKFNWDGHFGGAAWYRCDEAGNDLTDEDIDAFVFMPRPMLDKGAYVDYMTRRMQAAQDDLAKELLFCLLDEIESGRFDVRLPK